MTIAYVVVLEGDGGKVDYVGPFTRLDEADKWAVESRPAGKDWITTLRVKSPYVIAEEQG